MEDNAKPTLSAEEGIAPNEGDVDPLNPNIYSDSESKPIPVPHIAKETKKFNRHLMLVRFAIFSLVLGLGTYALREQLKPFLPAFLLGTDAIATTPIDDQMIEEMATAIIEENTATPLPPTPTPSPSPSSSPPPPENKSTPTPDITSTETAPAWQVNESEPLESHNSPKHARYFTMQPNSEYLELTAESGNSQFASESGYLLVFDPSEPNPENREQWLIGIPNEDGTYTYNLPVKEVTFIVNGNEVTILQTTIQIWNSDRENFRQAPKGVSFIVNGQQYYSDFADVPDDLPKDVFFTISYPKSLMPDQSATSHINPQDALRLMRDKQRATHQRRLHQGIF